MKDNLAQSQMYCTLAGGFSLGEKLYAQVSFIAMGVIGTVGISLESWPWVLPYVFIFWYGIPGIVMRHLVCSRCPHLYQYSDCLQLHPKLTRWLVKKPKSTPFSTPEKYLFLFIFILIPTYPLYWLSSKPILLIAFIITAAMWYAGQFLYFCKTCRVQDCPFNRVKIAKELS